MVIHREQTRARSSRPVASLIKSRRHSPPEAIPFVRGRQPRPAAARPSSWIDPATWLALQAQQTDAHRLATGADWWLERLGPDLLLSYATVSGSETALAELDGRCASYAFVPARLFGKHLPQQAAERGAPVLLRGDSSASLETEVREAGVRFGLDFAAGYSAGFFIDQRENRAQVRRLAPGRMLNTFAYTCSFSVIAALAGAETVSIDLSRRSLTRGEENFTRNGLDPRGGRHRFIADDVLAVLPRLARRGDKYDIIVLDPPTFSRNQEGAAWRVQDDFGKLLELALEVAAPQAHVLLSVNHSGTCAGDLEQMARAALRSHKRVGKFMRTAALPDFPPGHGASTIWLQLGN